jgi:hypothetical protein
MPHPLDRPIWTALTTRQQELAEGSGHARRYPTALTLFADLAKISLGGFVSLGEAALVWRGRARTLAIQQQRRKERA